MDKSQYQMSVASSLATAFLVFAAPLGIVMGMTIKAFDSLYPDWYLLWGSRIQLAIIAITIYFISRNRPTETIPTIAGSLMVFFVPLPLYFMLAGAGLDEKNIAEFATSGHLAYAQVIATALFIAFAFFSRKNSINRLSN